VEYICHRRQDYFKRVYAQAFAERLLRNMLYALLLNAFQHYRMIPKRGRVIPERNHFGGMGSWKRCAFE